MGRHTLCPGLPLVSEAVRGPGWTVVTTDALVPSRYLRPLLGHRFPSRPGSSAHSLWFERYSVGGTEGALGTQSSAHGSYRSVPEAALFLVGRGGRAEPLFCSGLSGWVGDPGGFQGTFSWKSGDGEGPRGWRPAWSSRGGRP